MDQAYFSTTRATGRHGFVQCLWVYDDAIDFDGLIRFHANLSRGLLGRRIDRSRLLFGRHHWVAYAGPDIDIADDPRPRAELSGWADERTQVPVDPGSGPCWHSAALRMSDGSTAVSLAISHCLLDGLGIGAAISDAVNGKTHDLGYPAPRSRPRLRAALRDARQTAPEIPAVARALATAVRQARERRRDTSPSTMAPRQPGDGDGAQVIVPMITLHVDLAEWDARAKALGGMSHHLVVGFGAKLGQQLGRQRPSDSLVTVNLPISERTENDTRAIALSFVSIAVDPTPVTTDLGGVRVANTRAFKTQRQGSGESPQSQVSKLAPLAAVMPKRALRRIVDTAFGYDDLPVGCSNGGDVDAALARLDGSVASYAAVRGGEQQVTRDYLEQTRGQLTMWAVRLGGNICITVAAYQPGRKNTKQELRELVTETLAQFDLAGVID